MGHRLQEAERALRHARLLAAQSHSPPLGAGLWLRREQHPTARRHLSILKGKKKKKKKEIDFFIIYFMYLFICFFFLVSHWLDFEACHWPPDSARLPQRPRVSRVSQHSIHPTPLEAVLHTRARRLSRALGSRPAFRRSRLC